MNSMQMTNTAGISGKAAPALTVSGNDRPGKSAVAVGQMAKQTVAAAREAGIELPSNAQGMAASQIAKGASPESIFVAQTAQEPVEAPIDPNGAGPGLVETVPAGGPGDVAGPDGAALASPVLRTSEPAAEGSDAAGFAASQYQQSVLALAGADTSAEIALDLLS